jgi:hypothetical protein
MAVLGLATAIFSQQLLDTILPDKDSTSGPASKFRCPKLDLLPAGVTKNNFRSYGYASDFSFSQRPKYLRF